MREVPNRSYSPILNRPCLKGDEAQVGIEQHRHPPRTVFPTEFFGAQHDRLMQTHLCRHRDHVGQDSRKQNFQQQLHVVSVLGGEHIQLAFQLVEILQRQPTQLIRCLREFFIAHTPYPQTCTLSNSLPDFLHCGNHVLGIGPRSVQLALRLQF